MYCDISKTDRHNDSLFNYNSELFPPLLTEFSANLKPKVNRIGNWDKKAKKVVVLISNTGNKLRHSHTNRPNWYNFNLEHALRDIRLPTAEAKPITASKGKRKKKPTVSKVPTVKQKPTANLNPLRISEADPELFFYNQINNG